MGQKEMERERERDGYIDCILKSISVTAGGFLDYSVLLYWLR